jgi:hypothetical protein
MARNRQNNHDEEGCLEKGQVETFKRTLPQIEGLLEDINELSKKKPDGKLNEFKLKFINEKLRIANGLLTNEHTPLEGFSEFSSEDLPSNSDVVLVLSQYITALKRWQSLNSHAVGFERYWNVKGGARITV